MKIYVMGDFHARWTYVNEFFKKYPEECLILQCGDFGYWPKLEIYRIKEFDLKNNNSVIYFCDGNHEDFESLKLLKNNEVCNNVFYMKRGNTLTLPDGRIVLFMGGAESIDKNSRISRVSWFYEETVTQNVV